MSDELDMNSCKYCAHVLSGIVISHTILECQYRQSMYCSVCLAYGHTPDDCPNKISWAIRQGKPIHNTQNLVLEVESSEEGVRDFLKSYNLKPGTRILENRKILRNLANSLKPPRMVHFVTRSK
jgi:hypothetical protein